MFIVDNEITITWVLAPTATPLLTADFDLKIVSSDLGVTYTDGIIIINHRSPSIDCAGSIQFLWTPDQPGHYKISLTTGVADSYLILDKKDFWVFCESPTTQPTTVILGANAVIPENCPILSGVEWTERLNPKDFRLNSIWFENGLWVAVGQADGTDAYIITSTDGVTWVERSNPKNIWLNSVIFAEGLWVAVGNLDGSDTYIITSTDGISWTERSAPQNVRIARVAYGNGQFVGVGNSNGTDPYVIYSANGTSWSAGDTSARVTTRDLRAVAYGAGVFCAVGPFICMSSSDDGVTWVDRTTNLPSGSEDIKAIFYDGDQFIALINGKIWTSPNGTVTWSELSLTGDFVAPQDGANDIDLNDGVYIIAGGDGFPGVTYRSTDLLDWVKTISDPDLNFLNGIHYGDQWIAVGNSGSDDNDASLITAP